MIHNNTWEFCMLVHTRRYDLTESKQHIFLTHYDNVFLIKFFFMYVLSPFTAEFHFKILYLPTIVGFGPNSSINIYYYVCTSTSKVLENYLSKECDDFKSVLCTSCL